MKFPLVVVVCAIWSLLTMYSMYLYMNGAQNLVTLSAFAISVMLFTVAGVIVNVQILRGDE